MAKFRGKLGYVKTEETAPGVHSEVVTERNCYAEVIRNTKRWESSEHLNDNLNISNQFSIVADNYAYDNVQHIRYITWRGVNWKISSIDIQRPRIIISVGGVYNGIKN